MKIGDEIRQRIDESIRVHEKLLIVLSKNSINSKWVQDEAEAAMEKENPPKKIVLFPVQLDNSIMKTDVAWAAKIKRTRHIGDFSDWKNLDSYKKAFERLVWNLKIEKKPE